ncbi:MAG: methyltransferase domain-containing protein [Candidatus Zixiibacteriota bacterium]|nr:MAG: methyltransferase domain-containing protein [candidate division Zixibacteria bacterium]
MVKISKKNSGWWDDFFPAFRPFFGLISQKQTNAQVRYITNKLDLKPGRKFLDCPCGIGRISLPLAKMGIKVTGVDITQPYLDELSKKADRRSLKINVARADMRRINFDSEFDAGGNLGGSFGYFEKGSDNRLVLKKMYRALRPGGKFMIQVINRDWIMANYQPRDWQEIAGVKSMEERHFDYRTSINYGKWHFIKDGKEENFKLIVRIYSFHELIAMFKSVGFADIEGYGSTKEEPISRDKQMMYIIGTKPRRK